MNEQKSLMERIPSIAWIFIFIGGIALVIGFFIGLFYGLSNFEGFASLIFLIIGYFAIRNTGSSLGNAMMIGFFALMGVAVDQPGNPIYNKPVEIWQCEDDTHLNRGVDVTHPLPERTDITQNFSCLDNSTDEVVKTIGLEFVALTRLLEYIAIGYFFMGFNAVRKRLFGKPEDEIPPVEVTPTHLMD